MNANGSIPGYSWGLFRNGFTSSLGLPCRCMGKSDHEAERWPCQPPCATMGERLHLGAFYPQPGSDSLRRLWDLVSAQADWKKQCQAFDDPPLE